MAGLTVEEQAAIDALMARRIGGALYNQGGTLTLTNSILASSTSGGNCSGGVTDGGYNISDDRTCGFTGTGASGQTLGDNINPLLDPNGLQDNGGPTDTIALLSTSPAISAIPAAQCPATDQRGDPRPAPGQSACDVGAFEGSIPAPTPSPSPSPSPSAEPLTERESEPFTDFDSDPVACSVAEPDSVTESDPVARTNAEPGSVTDPNSTRSDSDAINHESDLCVSERRNDERGQVGHSEQYGKRGLGHHEHHNNALAGRLLRNQQLSRQPGCSETLRNISHIRAHRRRCAQRHARDNRQRRGQSADGRSPAAPGRTRSR